MGSTRCFRSPPVTWFEMLVLFFYVYKYFSYTNWNLTYSWVLKLIYIKQNSFYTAKEIMESKQTKDQFTICVAIQTYDKKFTTYIKFNNDWKNLLRDRQKIWIDNFPISTQMWPREIWKMQIQTTMRCCTCEKCLYKRFPNIFGKRKLFS